MGKFSMGLSSTITDRNPSLNVHFFRAMASASLISNQKLIFNQCFLLLLKEKLLREINL